MPGGRTAKRSGAAEGREPAGAKPPRGGVLFPSLLSSDRAGKALQFSLLSSGRRRSGVVHRASTCLPFLGSRRFLRFREENPILYNEIPL
jgi:hypothetical protein